MTSTRTISALLSRNIPLLPMYLYNSNLKHLEGFNWTNSKIPKPQTSLKQKKKVHETKIPKIAHQEMKTPASSNTKAETPNLGEQ